MNNKQMILNFLDLTKDYMSEHLKSDKKQEILNNLDYLKSNVLKADNDSPFVIALSKIITELMTALIVSPIFKLSPDDLKAISKN